MQKMRDVLMGYTPDNAEELAYKTEAINFIDQYGRRALALLHKY